MFAQEFSEALDDSWFALRNDEKPSVGHHPGGVRDQSEKIVAPVQHFSTNHEELRTILLR